MANLFGSDIGLNYKGILNLGATVNQNVSGSLQYLTDGDGNNLPLQVATGLVGVDGGTIAYTTGTNSKDVLTQTYTINNTGGTNTITGIKVNATQTAIVGTTHSLLDLQVGGVTQFRVDNAGLVNKGTFNYGVYTGNYFGFYNGATILFAVDSVKTLNGYGEFRNFGNAYIGSNSFSPQARLHLRGDGVSNIFRVDNNLGSQLVAISSTGSIDSNSGVLNLNPSSSGIYFSTVAIIASVAGSGLFLRYGAHTGMTNGITLTSNSDLPLTITSGTGRAVGIIGTFAAAAGSALYRPLSIAYTINNTGVQTGNTTGIFLNATETALNSMGHNLIDLQVGGVSKFKVDRTGFISTTSTYMAFGAGNNAIGVDAGGFLYFQGANRFYVTNAGLIYGYNDLRNTGNIIAGGISISPLARLHIRGDGTNPIARFESNAGVELISISNAGNLSVTAGISSGNGLSIGGGGYFLVGADGGSGVAKFVIKQNSNYLGLYGSTALNAVFRFDSGVNLTNTTGTDLVFLGVRNTFNPTSGTASYSNFSLEPIINQTGGANGITRGVYVAPTLTAAADFRAIEVLAGSTSAHKLIRLANAAGNKVFEVTAAQEVGFFNTAPTGQQDVTGSRANPEEALANLLIALASYGIIIDNTTA